MNCVCGDPEFSHTPVRLSVELGTTPALTFKARGNVTYDSFECVCGCTTFLADD